MNSIYKFLQVFVRQAYLAVTEFDFCRLILKQSLTVTFLHLFFLSVLVAFCFAMVATWVQLPNLRQFLNWASHNLPSIAIDNGSLQVAGEQPIVRRYFGDQIFTFVYTEDQDLNLLSNIEAPAAVFQKEEFLLFAEGVTGRWKWKEIGPFIELMGGGPEGWKDWEGWLTIVFFPVVFLVQWLFLFVVRGMQAFLLMFWASSISTRHGTRLSYKKCFTIAVYSLTPAFILNVGVTLSGQQGLLFDLIYLGIAAVYTYFSTQKCLSSGN